MSIETAALFLAIIRLGSVVFILSVLYTQIPLLKAPNDFSTRITQYILLSLAVVILLGNVIPIAVDVGTVLGDVERSSAVLNATGIGYAFSNAFTSLFSAGLVWGMYRLIALSNKRHDK